MSLKEMYEMYDKIKEERPILYGNKNIKYIKTKKSNIKKYQVTDYKNINSSYCFS